MTINNKRFDHDHIEDLIYQLYLTDNYNIKFMSARGK